MHLGAKEHGWLGRIYLCFGSRAVGSSKFAHVICVLLQKPVTWTAVELHKHLLGKVNFRSQDIQSLTLPDFVPEDVEELLLILFVEASNSSPKKRGFVKVYTEVEGRQCAKYISLHTCPEKTFQVLMKTSWMVNSNNMWLPVGTKAHSRKVYVEVLDQLHYGKVSAEVYLIGYR